MGIAISKVRQCVGLRLGLYKRPDGITVQYMQ